LIERDLYRLALLRKCRGADALPLDELVIRANGAAAKVIGNYHDYLLKRLQDIEVTGRRKVSSWGPETWSAFHLAVHDVKSSAAMAGEKFVFDFARLLEAMLWRIDRSDPHLDIVVRLFLTALHAAADRSFAAAELDHLQNALLRIADRLSAPRAGARPDSASALKS
jgi:chemotaxis protein histidine kinase CheA